MLLTHLIFFDFFPGAGTTATVTTTDTHDGFDEEVSKRLAKRDAEIKEQRERLRADILGAVQRVTGKPPPLDVPLKQLASIARKSEIFDYRGTIRQIEALDEQMRSLAEQRNRIEMERRRNEEEEFILMTLI